MNQSRRQSCLTFSFPFFFFIHEVVVFVFTLQNYAYSFVLKEKFASKEEQIIHYTNSHRRETENRKKYETYGGLLLPGISRAFIFRVKDAQIEKTLSRLESDDGGGKNRRNRQLCDLVCV